MSNYSQNLCGRAVAIATVLVVSTFGAGGRAEAQSTAVTACGQELALNDDVVSPGSQSVHGEPAVVLGPRFERSAGRA